MSGPRPAPSVNAAFPTAGYTDLGARMREAEGWTSMIGTQQLVSTGFCADAGKFTATMDNLDRALDPEHAAGPYFGDLDPGIEIDVIQTWDATPYAQFTGQIDDFPQDYPLSGGDQVVPFQVTDNVGVFARAAIVTPDLPVQFTGERIGTIADLAGYTGARTIAHGNAQVAPLKFGQASAWPHMQAVAQSEWGDLYFDPDPTIGLVFRSRDQIASDTRSTVSQATYTDQPGGPLTYSGVQMVTLPMVNDCTIGYDINGNEVNAQSAESIAKPRGVRAIRLSLPLHYASQAQQYANWVVARYKDPVRTFQAITFTPGDPTSANPDVMFPELLARKLSDMVTVTRQPRGGGAPIVKDLWIRGIQHVGNAGVWKSTTFWLQDASWITGLAHFDVDLYDGPNVFSL